ncbi:unnamed protein product [Nyctereutes procyonoides]|uniref:(raccoon dog) hypothetical protein n=1 Tax=Nyctereutes procyonoides TaxID=34880 RepID=A0A811YVV3_NYCPR|nr:unnamed protein product [Nyctereutes procyonoides]
MFSFKNDKCRKSDQTKKINANLHNGECQHCKEVLLQELAKHSKYKPFQSLKNGLNIYKTVNILIMCRPGALCEPKVCAKYVKKKKRHCYSEGRKEGKTIENNLNCNYRRNCRRKR